MTLRLIIFSQSHEESNFLYGELRPPCKEDYFYIFFKTFKIFSRNLQYYALE